MNGYIPANKYDRQRTNRSQDPVKEPNELIPKLDGNGILQPCKALHRGGDELITGSRHQTGTNSDFFKYFLTGKRFRLQAVSILCNRREV